jgi:hypothetical protein
MAEETKGVESKSTETKAPESAGRKSVKHTFDTLDAAKTAAANAGRKRKQLVYKGKGKNGEDRFIVASSVQKARGFLAADLGVDVTLAEAAQRAPSAPREKPKTIIEQIGSLSPDELKAIRDKLAAMTEPQKPAAEEPKKEEPKVDAPKAPEAPAKKADKKK